MCALFPRLDEPWQKREISAVREKISLDMVVMVIYMILYRSLSPPSSLCGLSPAPSSKILQQCRAPLDDDVQAGSLPIAKGLTFIEYQVAHPFGTGTGAYIEYRCFQSRCNDHRTSTHITGDRMESESFKGPVPVERSVKRTLDFLSGLQLRELSTEVRLIYRI